MKANYETALIIGGSRGAGRELAVSLAARGTETHVVARSEGDLASLSDASTGIRSIAEDAVQDGCAERLISEIKPDLLILCVGATPQMKPFQTQSWDQFSKAWNADVKVAFDFMSAALTQPMPKGSTIVSFSSGAGLSGSRLSGGYAGAKRMQHFLTEYAQREADDLELDLRFLSIIPKQLVQSTEKGEDAAAAYAAAVGKPLDKFWEQWEQPLTAKILSEHVTSILEQLPSLDANAFIVTGEGIAAA